MQKLFDASHLSFRLFCILPLCAVHWKTKAVSLLIYPLFTPNPIYIQNAFFVFLPGRQSRSDCAQTKHKLSTETSTINTKRGRLASWRTGTDVLQIIVYRRVPLSFAEGKWEMCRFTVCRTNKLSDDIDEMAEVLIIDMLS